VIGYVQEARDEDAVAALRSLAEVSSTVVQDGVNVCLPSSGPVQGDLLVLGEGVSVGADPSVEHRRSICAAHDGCGARSGPDGGTVR
jgi:P-type Ca2+ transporter type 2C